MKMKTSFMAPFLMIVSFHLASGAGEFRSDWSPEVTRSWPGPEFWSNPLQDWRVADGWLECAVSGGNRNVYLLTREVGPRRGEFETSVRIGRLPGDEGELTEGWVGFRIGIRGLMNDYRDSAVRGTGLSAGIDTEGRLFIGRLGMSPATVSPPFDGLVLRLRARPVRDLYGVRLSAWKDGVQVADVARNDIRRDWLVGGMGLVCSAGPVGESPNYQKEVNTRGWGAGEGQERGGNVRFRFSDWTLSGGKVEAHDERAFGPVLFTLYTLSSNILKLTAQMAPVGDSCREVSLEFHDPASGEWQMAATSGIDPLSRTATFRVPGWDDTRDTPYRIVCTLDGGKGGGREFAYEGLIREDPREKDTIAIAAFTGNNDLGFPHNEIVEHVRYFDPDLLVYTGDQVYEPVGGYGIQRAPLETAVLDYLRKWYIYGWAHRDLTRDRPTVCLVDDHDVYQGNIWGAGGKATSPCGKEGQDLGGYCMPVEWVKMVHRTQTSHLPDPYDPTPVEQGIPVYYCGMVYGGVSFAVIEDRKWKSAPKVLLPEADIENGWAMNPDFGGGRKENAPGAVLLGDRQIEFLDRWAADWSGGAWMKVVLSQTLFANVATLPRAAKSDAAVRGLTILEPGEYAPDDKIIRDRDSNGWPPAARDRALRSMRRGFAIHISGDQHLGSTVQYGVDDWNDSAYALCVPSVSNIFPRRWYPPEPGRNRREGAPAYTGEFEDGFGNRVTVHAVSNPVVSGVEPSAINDRAPGYGIATLHRKDRTIEFANWPRWVDPSTTGANPYPGWPVEFRQQDNYGGATVLHLPTVRVSGMENPVVQLIDEANGEVVYTIRIEGTEFRPKVFAGGAYTLRVGEPSLGRVKEIQGLKANGGREAGDIVSVGFE